MTTVDPPDPMHDLLAAALTARTAASIGAPRLAVRAARRAGALADAVVIHLSPACARLTAAEEEEVLGDVRTTGGLLELLHPVAAVEESAC